MPNSTETLQNEPGNTTAVVGKDKPAGAGENTSDEKSFEAMRSSPRKKFQCNQRIAPMHGDILPQTDEYINVECNDLSQGGISFYLRRAPGCDRFAIGLGQKPMLTVLVGRVAYSREVQHNGERMYLVGCQFIDRLNA
jgi:hypothetical protein